MKQLTQKLGSGKMMIQEFPIPQLSSGMVLVKNHFSLISAGTEGSTVRAARKSFIGKAKDRPQQVKQVFEVLHKHGIVSTYRAVTKKLDAYSPLGYSSSGEVIEVSEDVKEFKIGDLVACAGGYANHAEIISVPINLCVKLSPDANLKYACYNTLGAIALQSVRQADLRLGEKCAVIGLGLIGQLVCLALKASGIGVVGIDISEDKVKLAAKNCADIAFCRSDSGIEEQIAEFTNGIGVDCVIIAAATDSLDPINFAGKICRKKGKVIILGAVPTGFTRENYYKKELELKMSCSYGPGRYDMAYEEKGLDYPVAYVRWTEKRNMQVFQDLLYTGKINLDYLTTHEFKFEDASKAYDIIVNKSEPFLGIVLIYNYNKNHSRFEKLSIDPKTVNVDNINIGFIGAGNYAQNYLLPDLPPVNKVGRIAVMTNSGISSRRVAEKFHFKYCVSNEKDILENKEINTLFIATRHNTHFHYVKEGIKYGKNIYVEKPLCLKLSELLEIEQLCAEKNCGIMVGFNRRFSPFAKIIKDKIGSGRMTMIYRINSKAIPIDSWIQDKEVGGGRIIGEMCHFIDFMTFICGSVPFKVTSSVLNKSDNLNDIVNVMIEFENGSIGMIAYYTNGSEALSKEYFEVHSSGVSCIIDDFKQCIIYGKTSKKHSLLSQDKGQKEMIKQFFISLNNGVSPIPLNEIFSVTKTTFAILKSIQENGLPVKF